MDFSNLVFIDKRGHDYGWVYSDGLWTGAVIIDKVSKGLFETEKIMCMQKYPSSWMSYEMDGNKLLGGVKNYEYGRMSSQGGNGYYSWAWDDSVSEVTEINMFRFDHSVCPPEDTSALVYRDYSCPSIELTGEVRINNLPLTACVIDHEDYDSDLKRIDYRIDDLVATADVVDICFCNEESNYNTFRRDLFLWYVDETLPESQRIMVAKISVYAESVEEDERFDTLCSNLGYKITNEDFKIFKESDIKEQRVDYRLMNEKRKELLMEGHNIYPYIGSYKSLINVIRYFGYDNVHIKEWWKNVDITSEDYGNYFIATSYSLEDRESVRVGGQNIALPSKRFRKTNRMTLAWDIDRIKKNLEKPYGRNEEHELPETEEVFAFTIEEAVIKLYGFRRKLEREFLPLNCHIVDVVGEMFGFDYNVIRLNASENKAFVAGVGCECDFNVMTESGSNADDEPIYIEDLRRFNVFNENAPQPTSGNVTLEEIYDQYIRDYNVLDENNNVIMPLVADEYETFENLDNGRCVIDGVPLRNGKPISIIGTPALYDVQDTKNGCTWNYYKYRLINESVAANSGGGALVAFRKDLVFENGMCSFDCALGENAIVEIRNENNEVVECGIIITPTNVTVTANSNPEGLYAIVHVSAGSAVGNYYVANFSHYYPNLRYTSIRANAFTDDMNEHLPDNENALCGALVRLQCTGLGLTWDEATVRWETVDCAWSEDVYDGIPGQPLDERTLLYSSPLCENYIRNHQRITWEVWKPEDETPQFFCSITGEFKYGYGDIGIMLPYIGKYSVRCLIRGYDNSISERIKTECIEVLPKNLEVTGWYTRAANVYKSWNAVGNVLWRDADFSWEYPYIACDATWDEMRTATYESLNRSTFAGEYYDSDDLDERMSVNEFNQDDNNVLRGGWSGMYFWENLTDVNWLGVEHLDWNATVIGGDARTHFVLGGFNENGTRTWGGDNLVLEIITADNRYGRVLLGENQTSESDVAYLTNLLNESQEEVISEFEYHYFTPFNHRADYPFDNIDENYYEIIAVARHTGLKIKDACVNDIANTPTCINGIWALSPTNYDYMRRWYSEKQYNPSWINATYINTYSKIPANTDVNLNYSVSRINGKCCPQWEIRNLDNSATPVLKSTHKNFHHLFRDAGRYNVRLEIMDTNGNKYVTDRCMFEIV